MISLTMTTAVFVVTLMEVVCRAIEKAMAYWNKHRHSFIWVGHAPPPAAPTAGDHDRPGYQTICPMNHLARPMDFSFSKTTSRVPRVPPGVLTNVRSAQSGIRPNALFPWNCRSQFRRVLPPTVIIGVDVMVPTIARSSVPWSVIGVRSQTVAAAVPSSWPVSLNVATTSPFRGQQLLLDFEHRELSLVRGVSPRNAKNCS